MKAVFFGTPEFGRQVLEKIAPFHQIILAVTRPDRPAGRRRRISTPPVKDFCRSAGIPCIQPEKLKDPQLIETIAGTGAALGLVVAYGGFLPTSLLEALPGGFINLHPSMLPRYRGAAPVNWAIIRGEVKTGLTTFLLNDEMDAGPVLMQQEIDIGPEETAGELMKRVAEPGADLMLSTIQGIEAGTISPEPQDDSLATFAPMLKKEDGLIDWAAPAREVFNLIRGVNPWPGAYCYHGRNLIKIHRSSPADYREERPGEILYADRQKGLVISTGDGTLLIRELQREGGFAQPFDAFLRGARWRPGQVLSSEPEE
jgi:methionyl-tRNA formyltransferase